MAINYDKAKGGYTDGATTWSPNSDGTIGVDEAGYVASVNNIRYKSLADAIAAAGAGGTVTLIDDVTLSSKLVLNQAQVFDLNGFTLDGAVSLSGEADVTFQNGKMTAAYSSTTSNSYSVVQVNGSSVLTLDGVTLTPADSSNRSQATHAIVYQSTGALNIKNSTVAGGNLVHDKNYTSGTNQAACAIYAYGNSAGTIQIEESTITGGAGKTDAEYDGTYKSGLYVEGGEAIKLGGSAAITINSSTVTGGASDWYNAADAVNVTNTFSGTLNIENASKISGGDALNLSGETSRGIGGAGIYTNQSTSCTEIVVTDSEIEGGNGGHSWNGSALELNTSAPEVTITNSTLTVGQGENSSGNAGAIRVNNTNTIDLNLNGVTLDGAGNANQVFQITSNVSNGGISLAGENTISGGTLENVTFIEVAEGTTITTTGDGKVDPVTVLNPVSTPVYDETTGAYVFEPVETSTATLLVNSNWASLPDGTAVQYDGANYRLGFNAFGDMNTAVSSIDRSYVLGDTFGKPITIEMTDATSDTLNLYGMNLVLTGNLTSRGSWNTALVASSSNDPNYITYLKLDNARIELTGNAALEGVNWGKAAVSFDKEGNIVASADQTIQRGTIVELVNGTVFDADNQVNGRGVFFKIDGTSQIYQYGTGNALITMTSGAIVDGGQSTAGDYTSVNQIDARWIYFGKGSSEWEGIYGDKTYFTFRNGANVEAKDRIEFGTGSLLKEMDVEIEASKIVATNNMIIGTENTENNAGKITSFVVSNNSLLQAGTDLSIVGTTVELSNSTLNAATVTLTDGKLNASGTSAITAEVSGDLDIVDGAAVTFGAGSTSDDLRIASGAEVTLRGSLSSGNIYGVDEKDTHEYNDGSNGITVNVATGDGETFKSYAWYASNGSTYNVMAGSNVELTYANINATGTINVAEGATLTTVMESSNIVGTLNVDGTANGVMTVYAGYTGGQFTNGVQAGEVNINRTGTVNTSIMTIGTAVRDDDKYNAAAVEGSNTTASVVVDGGTLNATGFEGELTSKLFVGSDDFEGVLTGKNGAKINVGERSENGTGYMRFVIGKRGTLSLAGSTLTVYNLGGTNNSVNGIFENSGTISMDLASQIITATVLNNNYGTITVDMSDATEFGVYKLVDYTGTSEVTGYGNVTLSNSAYETVVIDGDLFAANVDMSTLKVNAAWSTLDIGEQVADGFYYGFNAFDNLDKVYSTIAAGGVSQIELQSNVQLENGNPPISDMWFKFQDDVTIDSDVAGETRTITLSGHELLLTSMDQSRGNGGQQISITLGKDINILTDSAIWFGYCYDNADAYPQYAGNFATDITLNGSITMTSEQAHIFGHGSTMTITETGSLTVAGSDIQTRGSHLIVNGSGKEMAQAQVQLNHENIEGDSPLVITGDDFVDSPAAASWTLNNTFVNINTFLGINTATDSRASGIDAALKMNNSRLTVGQNLTMADAATVQLDNQSELSIGGNIELGFGQTIKKGASITVNNSSQLVAANLSIDAETSVNIGKNSEVTITEGITNNGAIVTDYTSTLAFGSITNDGTITIDTEGFSSGIYKILDYTGTGTYSEDQYKLLLGEDNWNDNYYSVENNDLYLTNLDGSEVRYVNSAWSSSNPYDEVMFVDGTRAYYGQNAFDTVDNALALPQDVTSYDKTIRLNVTGDIDAITVVGTNVTEVNVSAKPADLNENTVIDADAIVVNLVEIDNTNAGWQVYYPLAGGSNAQVYGNITTNFLSTTFTAWGEKTADPNFIGGAYAGSTATVYGNTTVNLGAADAADDALMLDTSFLIGAGAGTVNGNSSVNINSGTIQANAIVGGGAWRGQVKGDSSVTISGGQITVNSTEDSPGRAIIGGSYGNVSYDPDAPGDPAATAGKSSVTITGDAVVSGKVVGGSDISAVTNSSVTISGQAQVTGNVYGGGNRGGEVKETATVKLVDTATVDGNVYGGGFGTETAKSTVQGSTRVEVSGGTVTGNVYGGGENSSVGNTSVVVDGADVEAGIYGGSLNGDAGDTTVTISNFTRLQPVPGTQSDKIQIVGGGMAEAGKSSTTASTNVTVTDSRIYGDVVAGSSATGTGATAISGKSVVNVSNLEINGYSEGSNIWTGRVFGAGRAQYGGSVVTESTDVTIENMNGYTYDSEGNIIDGSNKGARVYGAGQAYASMSRVEVGETKLRISGDATNISEIYGGGIVSGTEVQEKAAFQIVGKTDVEITGGTVTDVIAGGNNTNWFGRTVIGVDAGDGTYQAAEGEYGIRLVIGGSTKVNEGALVTGGSYVDFAYEYQHIVDGVDTYGRTAEIYGNTYMELTGDSVISTDVFGGSFAYYEQVDFSADVSKLSAPSATQYGDVTVVVSGNTAIAGSVYGGGAVLTNTDQVKTTSVTNGDVSVLISGGAVGGNVYAGGYYADVNGNASVTLSGGTVGGDIYGGSEGSGTVAGSSTLNVGATDAARYTTTLNNVYDFDVANITNAAVTVEGVFSATQISIADSTLTLNSGFDAATTTVSIEVGAYNAENAALVLGSAVGTAPAISISAGSNALTEARYLVATGFDDTTAFSLDESLAGEYILRAVDGNIYLYNADAPYFTTELSVTQAEGASVDGYYSFTANFEAAGLLTGYTLKLYDSATATTPVDEVTLDADVIGQEFTLENTTQSFWISVTANGENGLSTDSPTSGRLEVVVKDYDSPVIQSVSSNVASDAITLTSEATDNFGVTGYEFILDGQSLGVQTGSEIALDLSTLTAGTHSYTVNVYDAAGNLATSAEQSFDFTPEPGPGPEPTEPANFLYSSQVRMNNGETVSVYATYSDAAAALEYRIGDSGKWLTYDATTGVNVSSSTTVYFREQGITDPVETAVDVTVVPADVELNAEVILLAPTTDTTYEVIYNFADGGSKAVELSGNSVEHYALPENTTVTIVEKDASGEVVNTIVEETPAASTTAEIPDKVVAVDDGHDNLFFAMPVGKWTGNRAQHQGDGVWGGTLEVVSLTGKNRFSTVFTGSDDATTLFLTDDANGDAFFLDDIYTANGSDARIRKMSEIQAGAGDDIVDLTSVRYAYEEHASKQLVIRGGDGNDILWGNAGHNIMFGDDGNDKIYGGSDNDVLIGGTGNDTMLGGGGDDIFCYGSSFDWGSDTITQLAGGTVTLYLDGIDRNDCSISGSTLTWNDGTHTGSITLNGVSWDSVKFYCAANGDGDLTKQSDYEELKNKGAFAAISSH